jgi:uncharacterized protein (DUF433 family)
MAVALRLIAAKLKNRQFTTAEVGAMLGLTTTEVNNLIDEVARPGIARAGRGKRTVEYRGLFAMLVAKELIHCQLKPELRRQALLQVLGNTTKRIPVPGTNLELLVQPIRQQINNGLRKLYEAEATVGRSSEVMQGEPCIKGTRVPVYMIGKLVDHRGMEETLATYPQLTERQVVFAQCYARAHPRKGPPKRVVIPSQGRVVEKKIIRRSKAGTSGQPHK